MPNSWPRYLVCLPPHVMCGAPYVSKQSGNLFLADDKMSLKSRLTLKGQI